MSKKKKENLESLTKKNLVNQSLRVLCMRGVMEKINKIKSQMKKNNVWNISSYKLNQFYKDKLDSIYKHNKIQIIVKIRLT